VIVVPARAPAGPLFVTARSALVVMLAVVVLLLFVGFESGDVLTTLAVLVRVPEGVDALSFTTSWKVAD